MKKEVIIAFAVAVISTSGCSTIDKRSVIALTKSDAKGKDLSSEIKNISNKGYFCQRMPVGDNPPPIFKQFTSDGTTNNLELIQCMKQSDYFFWITSTYTYVLGQYGKIVGIGHMGSYKSTTYLWDQKPAKAVCITKCLNSSGELR